VACAGHNLAPSQCRGRCETDSTRSRLSIGTSTPLSGRSVSATGCKRSTLSRMLVEPSPAATTGALPAQQRVGWQPSRFLADRAEGKCAFALAEQLGSIKAAAPELETTWPSPRKGFARHGLGQPARTRKRSAKGHRRRPPAHRPACHSQPGPGVCGAQPWRWQFTAARSAHRVAEDRLAVFTQREREVLPGGSAPGDRREAGDQQGDRPDPRQPRDGQARRPRPRPSS
jgi:hypothetical protein